MTLAAGPFADRMPHPEAVPPLAAPLPRSQTWRRFRAPAACAVALLVAAWLRTAPGAEIQGPWQYRAWAFAELAYSDVIALHADRGGGRHALPYFQDRIEYPALLGVAMWLPSVVAPSPPAYFATTFALIGLAALGVLWVLCAIPGTQPWVFAASPALLVAAPLNWDLLAILPLAAGLWLWAQGRQRGAAAALAAGACVKVLPVLALAVLCGAGLRRGARHVLGLCGIALAVALAVNLPFLATATARTNWAWFYEYSGIRDIEPSLWLLLGGDTRRLVAAANLACASATFAAVVAVALLAWRTARVRAAPALLLVLGVFFLSSKVYAPQYWLWVVAAAALAGAPGWAGAGLGAVALADYAASFSRLHLQLSRAGPTALWFERKVFWPTVALRYLALLAITAWAASEIMATVRGEPARAPSAEAPLPPG